MSQLGLATHINKMNACSSLGVLGRLGQLGVSLSHYLYIVIYVLLQAENLD